MAQPDSRIELHFIAPDPVPARLLVKRAIRDLEEANRELARLEARCLDLEARIAAHYGIKMEVPPA